LNVKKDRTTFMSTYVTKWKADSKYKNPDTMRGIRNQGTKY